ncbi:MAG: hypothetical protein ACE5SV_06640, partial [Candidatus Nitrosomaritimum aestuariumsis]
HDKPLRHNTHLTQSAVSPDNYTDAITCAHYNISQNCLSLTANTTLNHDKPLRHNTHLTQSAVSPNSMVLGVFVSNNSYNFLPKNAKNHC